MMAGIRAGARMAAGECGKDPAVSSVARMRFGGCVGRAVIGFFEKAECENRV